ncbi:hypothetical protein [Microbacterium sp. SD291]|uniref:hypothetical protein n=1 Tax=Microbacterium sp. SD291 TaxID=2782007 RepID=UPI001A957981|nr:hypothetical protein [Microbacterium sp. SD291]MBO0980625.1 hypothetical protein [Microbacterium sp. SD291]
MKSLRALALAGLAAVCTAGLTGCSVDALIWGSDGAQVIQTTEDLVQDMASGGASDLLCEGADVDLGAAGDWEGRSAGEPEKFFAGYWEDQVPLDPQWNINVEGLPPGVAPGDEFPGDVFYRETDDGLCVVDVVWSTLVYEG